MKKILVTHEIPGISEEKIPKQFTLTIHRGEAITKQELCLAVQNFDGILTMISDPIDREVLSQATRLKVISNYGIGLNNIDLELAKSKGIGVYNLPDLVTNSTADLTLAILLALVRKIPEAVRFVQEDQWKKISPMLFLGEELNRKTLGIVGFGRIGQAVAKRASAFGMSVIFYHRSMSKEIDPSLSGCVKQVEWEELLRESDYISLHVPLTPSTLKLIDSKAFAQMKRHPLIINAARGSIIDTGALIEALNTGQIRGAALDVTDPEPLPSSHPLVKAPNCLIVPHIGTATMDARLAMTQKALQQLIDHF